MTNLKKESPEQYQELLALFREKERRKNNNPAKSYEPNGKAEEFIKMVGANKTFVSMFIGANGTGKTSVGANIVTNICFGVQNKYFDLPIFQKWPYTKRGRIISDPTTLKEKIGPELRKWFPKNEYSENLPEANYEEAKEGKKYVSKFVTNTGWEIDLMSSEQDVKEFESVDLAFCWMDEPIPKDRFMASIARGRLGMIMFWTLTPLTYSAWIKNWLDDHNDGEYADYVEAEIEDNCKVHGVRGILEHENILKMVSAMSPDEKEARAFGKFGHLIGRVHKLFKRKIHVINPFILNSRDYTTYKALDTHPRVADHVLYMSVNRRGDKFITGEIISEGGVKDLHQRMVEFETRMNYRMEGRLIDPSAFNDDQHKNEKSVGKQLEDMGEIWARGSKDLVAGIKRTNDALSYEVKEGVLIKPPEVYFFKSCPVAIKQLEEYVWSEYKGSAKDEKKPRGTPKDINDHQPENLHRLLLSEPTYVPYQLRQPEGRSGKSYSEEEEALDPY